MKLPSFVSTSLARTYRCADGSGRFSIWLVDRFLQGRSDYLEERAVDLCQLKPNYRVLEVGYGKGVGLKSACLEINPEEQGKVCGVDISLVRFRRAARRYRKLIESGHLELVVSAVDMLPYANDSFDRIFHCNCYYFWPRSLFALLELQRVLRPGGYMITTIDLAHVKWLKSNGFLKFGNFDPFDYMFGLESVGFTDVHIDYVDAETSRPYQSIQAYKSSVVNVDQLN